MTGKFEKGKPAAITRDDQTVYKLDQQIVFSREGTWELFQMPQFGGAPGGARGAGGGAGAPPAGGPRRADLRREVRLRVAAHRAVLAAAAATSGAWARS